MTLERKKPLSECLAEMSEWVINTYQDAEISGIAWDSRKVRPGDAFFALVGTNFDGHRFTESAVENGAAAVIGTKPGISLDVPYIQLNGDDRLALAKFASCFMITSEKLVVIGSYRDRW